MKKLLLLIVLIFISSLSYSQSIDVYSPMECFGTIPSEFITPIEGRYNKAVKQIDRSEKRKTRIDKRDFLLESHNELDVYFKSGRVVFNDAVYQYINKVAAVVLKSEGSKAENVKFFPIKYEYSNAFAFNEGVIFVNIGLIARCRNEAELAFVLGHEYAHYIKRHSINYNVELKKASRSEGTYRKKNVDDKLSLMSRFSKSNEIDADVFSYNLLKKTAYNPGAAISSLQSLAEANSIPGWAEFDKRVIERGMVRIPKAYLLENKVDTIVKKGKARKVDTDSEDEEDDEEESFTHPSIDERVNEIWDVLKAADTLNKALYANAQTEFEYIQEVCRFEMCRIYLKQNQIDEAFCLVSSLLEKYPSNEYLNRMMAVVLYRISFAAVNGRFNSTVQSPVKSSEELKDRNYLFHQLSKEEIVLLSLRFAWDVKVKQPENKEALAISNQLIKIYTYNFKQNLALFADPSTFSESVVDSLQASSKVGEPVSSKGGKKKTLKKIKGASFDFQHSFSFYALSDIKNDETFKEAFEAAAKEGKKYAKQEQEEDESIEEKPAASNKKGKKKNADQIEKEGDESIYSMILIEPEFELIDNSKKIPKNYIANEVAEAKLRKAIVECSEQAGFDVALLNANSIQEDEIQKMNDYMVLKEFIYESFTHDDNKNRTLPTDYTKIQEISSRYGTRYVSVMINRNLITKHKGKEFLWAALISLPLPYIGIPLLISRFFPEKEFVYVIGVLDMYDGKIVYGSVLDFDRRETADLFKSQFYATLIELKGKS